MVTVKRSITPEHLICLEVGQRFKRNMSPDDYRAKLN